PILCVSSCSHFDQLRATEEKSTLYQRTVDPFVLSPSKHEPRVAARTAFPSVSAPLLPLYAPSRPAWPFGPIFVRSHIGHRSLPSFRQLSLPRPLFNVSAAVQG